MDHYSGNDPETGCALLIISAIVVLIILAIGVALLMDVFGQIARAF